MENNLYEHPEPIELEMVDEEPGEPDVPPALNYFQTDVEGVVISAFVTNAPQSGDIVVSDEMIARFSRGEKFKLDGDGFITYEPPAPELTQQDYSSAIQRHLDETARQRHYDGIQSALTYRGDPNPSFSDEAEALFNWRSQVWTYATQELARVTSGQRDQPTVEELIEELPPFTWPPLDADQGNLFEGEPT